MSHALCGDLLKCTICPHISFKNENRSRISMPYMSADVRINFDSSKLCKSTPPFVSPATCFGFGIQLMDSSEWHPLKWHYFKSVNKLGSCYLVLPHSCCSRSEPHLSLSISAVLSHAGQASQVEPSIPTARCTCHNLEMKPYAF